VVRGAARGAEPEQQLQRPELLVQRCVVQPCPRAGWSGARGRTGATLGARLVGATLGARWRDQRKRAARMLCPCARVAGGFVRGLVASCTASWERTGVALVVARARKRAALGRDRRERRDVAIARGQENLQSNRGQTTVRSNRGAVKPRCGQTAGRGGQPLLCAHAPRDAPGRRALLPRAGPCPPRRPARPREGTLRPWPWESPPLSSAHKAAGCDKGAGGGGGVDIGQRSQAARARAPARAPYRRVALGAAAGALRVLRRAGTPRGGGRRRGWAARCRRRVRRGGPLRCGGHDRARRGRAPGAHCAQLSPPLCGRAGRGSGRRATGTMIEAQGVKTGPQHGRRAAAGGTRWQGAGAPALVAQAWTDGMAPIPHLPPQRRGNAMLGARSSARERAPGPVGPATPKIGAAAPQQRPHAGFTGLRYRSRNHNSLSRAGCAQRSAADDGTPCWPRRGPRPYWPRRGLATLPAVARCSAHGTAHLNVSSTQERVHHLATRVCACRLAPAARE
jgi:hypothetical protein